MPKGSSKIWALGLNRRLLPLKLFFEIFKIYMARTCLMKLLIRNKYEKKSSWKYLFDWIGHYISTFLLPFCSNFFTLKQVYLHFCLIRILFEIAHSLYNVSKLPIACCPPLNEDYIYMLRFFYDYTHWSFICKMKVTWNCI